MKSYPTNYRGIEFRSRTEARWAATFDGLGWTWIYEPCDFDGWIPDFQLEFQHAPLIVEVKPALSAAELLQYTAKIEASGCPYEVLLIGATWWYGDVMDSPEIGLLSRASTSGTSRPGRVWQGAALIDCDNDHIGLLSTEGAYRCRRCGFSRDEHEWHPVLASTWEAIWNDGQNLTKWVPRNQR